MTPRQREVAEAIVRYRYVKGMSPTLQELREVLGISKTVVREHLMALQRKGIIRRMRYGCRAIELTGRGDLPARRPLKFPVWGTIDRRGVYAL